MVPSFQAWLSSAWLIAQLAAAGGSWDARMERAISLRLSGHEEQALALFREAEKERTSPRFLAQMALTEQSLGLWVDAEQHLERALVSSDDAWISKNQAALRDARAIIRDHLGTLELRGDLRGELRVDGRLIGGLPTSQPVRLQVGPHRVEVSHPGAYPLQRDVEIRAGETARETIVLSPVEPAVSANAAAAARSDLSPSSSPASKAPGIVLVAVGVAAAGAGVATLLASNARATDYNDNAACLGRPTDPPSCEADKSATGAYRTLATVAFATAGVSSLLGGWFLLRAGKSGAPVGAAVSNNGATLTFRQRF